MTNFAELVLSRLGSITLDEGEDEGPWMAAGPVRVEARVKIELKMRNGWENWETEDYEGGVAYCTWGAHEEALIRDENGRVNLFYRSPEDKYAARPCASPVQAFYKTLVFKLGQREFKVHLLQ